MAALFKDLTLVAADIFKQIAAIATAITGEPLLLMTVGFLFVGGCVGIFGRLLSRN